MPNPYDIENGHYGDRDEWEAFIDRAAERRKADRENEPVDDFTPNPWMNDRY